MKNLKIKFGLFSLLAVLATSVFLTSCEQDILNNPANEIFQDTEILSDDNMNLGLILPEEFDTKSTDEINEYINSLTSEQFEAQLEELVTDETVSDREACTSCYYYRLECTTSCNGLPHRKYWYQKCVIAGRTVYLYCGYYSCSY